MYVSIGTQNYYLIEIDTEQQLCCLGTFQPSHIKFHLLHTQANVFVSALRALVIWCTVLACLFCSKCNYYLLMLHWYMQYAGIMKRSDGKCHLDNGAENEFTLAGEFVSDLQSWLAYSHVWDTKMCLCSSFYCTVMNSADTLQQNSYQCTYILDMSCVCTSAM